MSPGDPDAANGTLTLGDEAATARQSDLIERFLKPPSAMDISATGAALDEMFAQGSFESIVDDLLMPALACAWRGLGRGPPGRGRGARGQRGHPSPPLGAVRGGGGRR